MMKMVEIVEAMMAYNDPISHTTYLLGMRNALSIPSMGHNLIPPFLIRKAGLALDETPKFQLDTPMINNHAIIDDVTGMRFHLKLNGIFSYLLHVIYYRRRWIIGKLTQLFSLPLMETCWTQVPIIMQIRRWQCLTPMG
jgi:hypothetical protein